MFWLSQGIKAKWIIIGGIKMIDVKLKVIQVVAATINVKESDLSMEKGVGDIPDWDSLGHVNIIAAIEEAFGLFLDVEEALDCETIQDIVEVITEKINNE